MALLLCVGVVACRGGRDDDSATLVAGTGTGTTSMRQFYGDDRNQFGDLTVPDAAGREPLPVVVLIHGGFWRTGYGLDLMEPLVPSLADAGYAVWNVEYRRVGGGPEGGGGYPAIFDDLAAAIDLLDALPADIRQRLDLDRVATVGHSAGGHLAGWLAGRTSITDEAALPPDSTWSTPAVIPVLAISQAGVLDLERCIADGVGGTACRDLLQGDVDAPGGLSERIALTSPAALLPLDARVVAVHGDRDDIVPLDQSTGFVADALAAGASAEIVVIEGADHFDVIDPAHRAWTAVLRELAAEFGNA